MHFFFAYLIILNVFSYSLMWVDKLKSIYQWWRISERTLWILACLGGVYGIWLGMQVPLYHKAGKKVFRVGIPIIGLVWVVVLVLSETK